MEFSVVKIVERMRAMDRAFRKHYPECPGPCRDGQLRLTGKDGKNYSRPCHLLERTCPYGRALAQMLDREALSRTRGLGIPSRFLGRLLAPSPSDAVRAVTRWRGKGFLTLLGGTGTGKSFGAALRLFLDIRSSLGETWADPGYWSQVGFTAKWISAYRITVFKEELDEACGSGYLVLDDLGEEINSASAKAAVKELVSERYNWDRPTIITTNLSQSMLVDRYGDRMVERLIESGDMASCNGASLRLRDAA